MTPGFHYHSYSQLTEDPSTRGGITPRDLLCSSVEASITCTALKRFEQFTSPKVLRGGPTGLYQHAG
jgi:hypothetical protein